MKKRSVSPIGALHPILFFAGVYVVVLFFSIFICSALFYSCNTSNSENYSPVKEQKKDNNTQNNSTALASIQ